LPNSATIVNLKVDFCCEMMTQNCCIKFLMLVGSSLFSLLAHAQDILSEPQWNTFFKAVERNKVEEVRNLLNRDRSGVKVFTYDGRTALHIAARNDRADIAQLLLDAGADPNARSNSILGETPLHVSATMWSDKDRNTVLPILIASGARVDIADTREGSTALHKAAYGGYIHNVTRLLAAGANPNARDQQGKTPLHQALYEEKSRLSVIKTLLANGANVHARDNDKSTALHTAAYSGDLEAVQALLNAGATSNAIDSAGETPLHVAARANQLTVAETLLKRMNRKAILQHNKDGDTALDIAARQADVRLITLLMEQGLQPNVSQLVWLLDRGAHAAAKALTANQLQLVQAIRSDMEAEFAKVARNHMIDGMSRPAYQVHALLFLGQRQEALKRLQAFDKILCGEATPLMDAVERKSLEAAKALLEVGADPNAQPPAPTRAWFYEAGPMSSSGIAHIRFEFAAPCKQDRGLPSVDTAQLTQTTEIQTDASLLKRFAPPPPVQLSPSELRKRLSTGWRTSVPRYMSTALVMSVESHDLAMTKLLLQYRADPTRASAVLPDKSAQTVWLERHQGKKDAAQWRQALGLTGDSPTIPRN
jgi:ankyrin repeat protein